MAAQVRQLKLGAFLLGSGHHVAGWRHPNAAADGDLDFDRYRRVAQTAERGKFDMIFFADTLAIRQLGGLEATSRSDSYWVARFEPIVLLSALALVTSRIGLVTTASTTYYDPYHVARKFASLDHLSAGRAGWNLVTSDSDEEAQNFGHVRQPEHDLRYDRAREFIDVTRALWDSWGDDAFVIDKASGRYFDPEKLFFQNHKGKHFSVRGPLNVARSPQGHPVVVQAGSSAAGQALAAETADVVFTAQQTLPQAKAFYCGLKEQVATFRSPDDVKIMPGVFPVIGSSEQEARDKFGQLQSLVHPSIGLGLLQSLLGGFDLSSYPIDGPLPDLPIAAGGQSRQRLLIDLARQHNLSIRDLYLRNAAGRGHCVMIGTATQIADQLQDWFENNAADGFNIMPPVLPGGLDDFVNDVIPELQRRGLYRLDYEGRTLRENLGLSRPCNRFVASKIPSEHGFNLHHGPAAAAE